jgi:hypothetical protein
MDRCIYNYGLQAALFFLVIAIFMKFVLENCMIAIFIFIYNSLYWELIKEESSQIYLNFDKTSREKKFQMQRSIFSRGNSLTNPQTSNPSGATQTEIVFGKTKNISNFLYINRAIKHFKNKRGASTQLRPSMIKVPVRKAQSKILDDKDLENLSEYYHEGSNSPTIRHDSPFKQPSLSISPQPSLREKDESKNNMPFEIEILETENKSPAQATNKLGINRQLSSFTGDGSSPPKLSKTNLLSKSFHFDTEYPYPSKAAQNRHNQAIEIENEETTAKEKSDPLFLPLETEGNKLIEEPKEEAVVDMPIDSPAGEQDTEPANQGIRAKKNKILPAKHRTLMRTHTSNLP